MKEKFWKNVPGGICSPRGFVASAEYAGLKKSGLDVAVIFSERPASVAACFTKNRCPAAPVELSRRHLRLGRGRGQAILANSGCANAATGLEGLRHARRSVQELAKGLNIPVSSVLVCSTGVIGLPLAVDKLIAVLPRCLAGLNPGKGKRAAEAISTTDTVLKIESIEFQEGGRAVRIGGIAKGAGMIHPDMATMLAFITTDAAIPPAQLQRDLNWCVERSFNSITVDGDTSTNDTVIVLANGAAGAVKKRSRESGSRFRAALLEVCRRLARKIAWDGEGATYHLEIQVGGARSFEEARNVGRSIGRSNLVKTAIYGKDPNWGRLLSAVGASGEVLNASRLNLSVNGKRVAEKGVLKNLPDAAFASIWKKKRIRFQIELGQGKEQAVCWSCDLSHEYIDINGSYRS
jgi:glutamate N-acetyltransferase/amino-acid N-acetyltransferase